MTHHGRDDARSLRQPAVCAGCVAIDGFGDIFGAGASGCGPAPTALENPPEMARVDGRLQSIELEIRQDGARLCFVDRNNSDRPGIAPTIRIRPGEILRVRLFDRINDPSVLRKTTPPGHATNFPGVPGMPGYLEVVPGDYHEPTGNTNLHFHGLEVKPRHAVRALRRATTSSPRISFRTASRRRAARA